MLGRPVRGEQRARARRACRGRCGTSTGRVPSTVTTPSRSMSVATGSRPTNENRLQRSPCSTDSSRNPAPSPTSLANAATGVSRSASSSVHTGTTVCVGGERAELVAARADAHALSRSRSGGRSTSAVAGVAGAAAVLVDLEQQHVAVAVVVRLAHELAVAAGVALAPHLLAAAAPVDHAPFGERALQGLGVHPRHHQHVAGVGVLGDGRHQPVGVELDPLEIEVDRAHRYRPVDASMRSAATAWRSRSRSMM